MIIEKIAKIIYDIYFPCPNGQKNSVKAAKIIFTDFKKKIKWPEKQFCKEHSLVDMNCEYCQKRWFGNQAIDACKKAWEESQ